MINEDGVITWRNDSEQPDAAIRQALAYRLSPRWRIASPCAGSAPMRWE